ncbi:class I SAM-dependent methyltransferase [Cohnella yongneupensis]|uniref:Class I SAM-dependent methyltransferase n=1 Tax=Cohnella yongneupensis TaxID=425006 RepID=A0ABW0R6M0_9BACL
MHRYWDKVIKPILIASRPRTIVEIGSMSGLNTFKLLDYCKYCNANCFIIEQTPLYNVELLKAYYGHRATVMERLSLDALPEIVQYDLLLVDGDHNWYTVYHELALAEQMAQRTGRFPIVLLHDTDWPYGRRDMYASPESIPPAFRQAYARQGMEPGRSALLESGGFNAYSNNAVSEHGDRNGVLTAIEDFMKRSVFDLRLFKLYSHHGLGILVPSQSELMLTLPYIIAASGM